MSGSSDSSGDGDNTRLIVANVLMVIAQIVNVAAGVFVGMTSGVTAGVLCFAVLFGSSYRIYLWIVGPGGGG